MAVSVLDFMNIIGAIAFAIAGALVAVQHEMDIFGVNVLAVITATGGGMIRDIIMGDIPPMMFRDPRYVLLAVVTANVVFVYLYYRGEKTSDLIARLYERALFWFDTLGLAAFTVGGVLAGYRKDESNTLFLIVFLGVVTGVGGGLLRDICANSIPMIFVKRVYAVASIIGAVMTGLLLKHTDLGTTMAAVIGGGLVVLIRVLAHHYRWHLPRIKSS
ncbi:MAG: TRIC cation channel family protein [Lachnospiraceae bacterium]|nr:TRIC cation channel family protein [Lachnospiraceae bacterium]